MIPYKPMPLTSSVPYPEYNSNNIMVFDDYLPQYLVNDGIHQLSLMQWEYGHVTDANNLENDVFFGRQLYHKLQGGVQAQFPAIVSNLTAAIERIIAPQIDPNATFQGIYRISANGYTQNMKVGPHIDTRECNTLWTAVYMANISDGALTFYTNNTDNIKTDSVEFVPGRIVVFPSGYTHEAEAPVQSKWRVTIGIMFDLDTRRQYDNTTSNDS